MPITVIDTSQGKLLSNEKLPAHILLGLDLQIIVKSAWNALTNSEKAENTNWLHTNHLGAPEAATNSEGQIVWQASYAPFGAASIVKASVKTKAGENPGANSFSLNLRLPGQYEDQETGLHYNKQRYYDPARGEYLSPDPLGTPDGPNGYAYVRYNPLKYVDPEGLILFAFDGTGNDLRAGAGVSNVVRFRNAYQNGERNYVSGVGTVHTDTRYGDITVPLGDAGVNRSGVTRIDRMMMYFVDSLIAFDDNAVMDVDVIGFSRGAAQARDFSNQVTTASRQTGVSRGKPIFTNGTYQQNGKSYYRYLDDAYFATTGNRRYNCQWVNFRFMGLWDTVISTNSGRRYDMGIPAQFAHVAHATALNEYRSADSAWDATRRNLGSTFSPSHWGGFPLESIGASSNAGGGVRIERGFIGAHADVGAATRVARTNSPLSRSAG